MHEGDGYWLPRSHFSYYKQVRAWLNESRPGGRLCDVGGGDTPVSGWGDYDTRVNVTLEDVKNRLPHVDYVKGDFRSYNPDERFDTVTCLQVLEHFTDEDVIPFTAKLFSHATEALIISVPFRWPEGKTEGHRQDPIDKQKLLSWTGREPDDCIIIGEDLGPQRIVARFFT